MGGTLPGSGGWTPPACNMDEKAFAPARIWQLTDAEYVNVVRDVLTAELPGAIAYLAGRAS